MKTCKYCGTPIHSKMRVCPACGARVKKPLYKKGGILILAVIAVVAVLTLTRGEKREQNKSDTVTASNIESMMEVLPKPSSTAKSTPTPEASPTPTPTAQEPAAELVDGMRPEFKEAMDSYEAFYNEYCDFMEKYSENPADLELLAQYSDMLSQLAEMDEKFEAWDSEELNAAELKYYLEVSARVTQKLYEAAQ